jgi:hypothetical protein
MTASLEDTYQHLRGGPGEHAGAALLRNLLGLRLPAVGEAREEIEVRAFGQQRPELPYHLTDDRKGPARVEDGPIEIEPKHWDAGRDRRLDGTCGKRGFADAAGAVEQERE